MVAIANTRRSDVDTKTRTIHAQGTKNTHRNRVVKRSHCPTILRTLMHTGMDIGELFLRRVTDCDFDRAQPRIWSRRTKTKVPTRIIPIPAELVTQLRGHIATHTLSRSDLMFGMVERKSVEKAHGLARKACGQDSLRIKDLRHIAAILWRKGGADIQSIQEWLGHATPVQTAVYARFRADDAFDARIVEGRRASS